jgi:hypothetical protein
MTEPNNDVFLRLAEVATLMRDQGLSASEAAGAMLGFAHWIVLTNHGEAAADSWLEHMAAQMPERGKAQIGSLN